MPSSCCSDKPEGSSKRSSLIATFTSSTFLAILKRCILAVCLAAKNSSKALVKLVANMFGKTRKAIRIGFDITEYVYNDIHYGQNDIISRRIGLYTYGS
jgi:hypothetical protein